MSRLPLTGAGPSAGYSAKVLRSAPIAYWPMWEASGTTAYDISGNSLDASYTGVTLGQTGIGDGNTCPLFDGSTSTVDIYSSGLNTAFSGTEGSISFWAKVYNVGVWTDDTERKALQLFADGNNKIQIVRDTGDNTFGFIYKAGGTQEVQYTSGLSTVDFFQVGITWSDSGDKVIYYLDGVQTGSTDTGVGTWAENLDSGECELGNAKWYGWLAHCAIFDTPLSATSMLYLATV